jgi:hypothetical protein
MPDPTPEQRAEELWEVLDTAPGTNNVMVSLGTLANIIRDAQSEARAAALEEAAGVCDRAVPILEACRPSPDVDDRELRWNDRYDARIAQAKCDAERIRALKEST